MNTLKPKPDVTFLLKAFQWCISLSPYWLTRPYSNQPSSTASLTTYSTILSSLVSVLAILASLQFLTHTSMFSPQNLALVSWNEPIMFIRTWGNPAILMASSLTSFGSLLNCNFMNPSFRAILFPISRALLSYTQTHKTSLSPFLCFTFSKALSIEHTKFYLFVSPTTTMYEFYEGRMFDKFTAAFPSVNST